MPLTSPLGAIQHSLARRVSDALGGYTTHTSIDGSKIVEVHPRFGRPESAQLYRPYPDVEAALVREHDVVYRSGDGGVHWSRSTVGHKPRIDDARSPFIPESLS